MNIELKIILYFISLTATVVFYLLDNSFKNFSKISLTGFLDDIDPDKKITFDFIKNHELVKNSFGSFSLFLQLTTFVYTIILISESFNKSYLTILLITFLSVLVYIFVFNLFLYSFSYFKKEKILKNLLFLFPIPWYLHFPVNKIFSVLLKKFPENIENESDELTEKELKVFIEEGTKEGVIETEDKEMIESILEFGDTVVKEIMTPRVDMIYISKDITLKEMIDVFDKNKKSRYPVIDGRIDNITGIVLAKDIFSNLNKKDFKVSDVIRQAFFIPETMRILKLLNEMQKTKQKFAIVVDEFGGVSGLITMEDIVEEIVGEISDEYDEDVQQIIREKDYFIVNGNTEIDELNSTININIDVDEDFQTVAGLINFETGKIPKVSDKINIDGYVFEILEVEKNRITKVKIYEKK